MNRRIAAILIIVWLNVLLVIADPAGTAGETALDGEGGSILLPVGKPASEDGDMKPAWPDRWRETMDWPDVNGPFVTDTEQPLVLHRFAQMADGLIYFADNRLWHEYAAEEEPGGWHQYAMATFQQVWQMQIWTIGNGWLFGGSALDGEEAGGMWVWLDLSRFAGPPYYFEMVRHANFHPGKLVRMTVSDDPALAVAMVARNGRPEEHVFVPGDPRWQWLYANNWDTAAMPADGENATTVFAGKQVFDLDEAGTLYALEDDWGTLLVSEREDVRQIWRFAGYRVLDFKLVPSVYGKAEWLGQWLDPEGNVVYVMPDWHFAMDAPLSPELWEGDWVMVRHNGFLRVAAGALEGMRYDPIWHEETFRMHLETWSTPLEEARYVGREGRHLVFRHEGRLKRMSIHDAYLYRQTDALAGLDSLWRVEAAYDLHPVSDVEAEPAYLEVHTPAAADLHDRAALDPMPAELEDVLQRECWIACGDFSVQIVVRQVGEQWFVLAGQTLHAFDGDTLEPVAEWPVNNRSTVYYEKGGESATARDFAKIGNFWYVADTHGHRVLQLDDQHRMRNEITLPFPVEIKEEEAGLLVTSLQGLSRLTYDLAVVEERPLPADSFDEWTDHLIEENMIHVDEESGWTWLVGQGWLYRFHGETGQLERRYIGYPFNGYTRPLLIPHAGEVWVVLDEHALRFAADGRWLATSHYPRTGDPFIYNYPYTGEMTWQLDEDGDRLYFVRGVGVHELNLATGEHRELFRQAETTIGPLLLVDGKLLFTLHTGGVDDFDNLDHQLVVLDPQTGGFTRYELAHGIMTFKRDERGIIVAEPQMVQEFRLDYYVLEMDVLDSVFDQKTTGENG